MDPPGGLRRSCTRQYTDILVLARNAPWSMLMPCLSSKMHMTAAATCCWLQTRCARQPCKITGSEVGVCSAVVRGQQGAGKVQQQMPAKRPGAERVILILAFNKHQRNLGLPACYRGVGSCAGAEAGRRRQAASVNVHARGCHSTQRETSGCDHKAANGGSQCIEKPLV